jgi:hypothetical protein
MSMFNLLRKRPRDEPSSKPASPDPDEVVHEEPKKRKLFCDPLDIAKERPIRIFVDGVFDLFHVSVTTPSFRPVFLAAIVRGQISPGTFEQDLSCYPCWSAGYKEMLRPVC